MLFDLLLDEAGEVTRALGVPNQDDTGLLASPKRRLIQESFDGTGILAITVEFSKHQGGWDAFSFGNLWCGIQSLGIGDHAVTGSGKHLRHLCCHSAP